MELLAAFILDKTLSYTSVCNHHQGIHFNAKNHIIAHWFNDKLHGEYRRYYQTRGSLCLYIIGTFQHGKRIGIFLTYYPSGNVESRRTYSSDGFIEQSYYDSDQLRREFSIVNDKLHGTIKKYRADGTLERSTPMCNGKKHGICMSYHPNGRVMVEREYHNDVKNGTAREYYDNGSLRMSGEYLDDQYHGTWKSYNLDGTLHREKEYNKGVFHGKVYISSSALTSTRYYYDDLVI